MRRLLALVVVFALVPLVVQSGPFKRHSGGGSFVSPPGITLDDITLSNRSFPAGSTTGTLVGVATVLTTNGAFTGSQSLSGTDAASFALTGCSGATCNLVTVGTLCGSSPPCSYSINIVATQSGATGSPKTVAFGITSTAAGVLSSTVAFVNDGGTTMAAGVPTKTFAQWFKDGHLCSGAAPVFKDGSQVQKFSASPPNARVYYASGCLKGAVFQLLPTFTVTAGQTKNIDITGGGSWPTMGSGTAGATRALSEVYAQALQMNFKAQPDVALPLSDTFSIKLNNDINQYRVVKWLDGDAGTYWKFSATAQGGNGDPHRVGDFYLQALTHCLNPPTCSSTDLGGFRWLGTLRNPFYNLDTPTKTRLLLLAPNPGTPTSGTNWQVNAPGGGTVTVAPPWPYGGASQAFTVSSGQASTNATNTLFQGSNDGQQVIPVQVHCGPCPANLIDTGNYFARAAFNSRNFIFSYTGQGNSQVFPGDGVGTISPTTFQSMFERFTMAGADANYVFFQGSGSITAETTLRFKQDKSYLSSAGVMPPYNLSYTAANLTDANDQSALNYIATWSPYSIGNLEWSQSAAGNQQFIGPLPNAAAVDFMVQQKGTDDLIRMIGLSAGLNTIDLKTYHPGNADHDQLLNFLSGTYTGLSNTGPSGALSTTMFFESGLGSGFTQPDYDLQLGFDSGNFEHKPRFAAWAYMKTGELQYLDYIDELGQCSLSCEAPNLRNPGWPTSRVGVATAWGDSTSTAEARAIGWGFNDQAVAALLHPFDPSNPNNLDHNGTQLGKYFRDAAANSIQLMADIQAGQNNFFDFFTGGSAATTYLAGNGFWTSFIGGLGYMYDAPEWERSYVMDGVAWAAMSGNTLAKTVLANDAVWQNHLRTALGGYSIYGYYESVGDNTTGSCGSINHCAHNMNTADNQFTVNVINAWTGSGQSISWNQSGFTSSPTRYFRLNQGPVHYTFGNGDIVVGIPSYTIQDFDGTNFNAALSDPPHTIAVPAGTGTFGGWSYMPVHDINNCPGAGCNQPATPDYPIVVRHINNWRQAILGTDANSRAVQLDAENRMANSDQGPVTELLVGARWAIQNHFGP